MNHNSSRYIHQHPPEIRALNAACGALGSSGIFLPFMSLNDDSLHVCSRQMSGLKNFRDSNFLPAFRVLTKALREESDLTSFGKIAMRQYLAGRLSCRMAVEEQFRHTPPIAEINIRRPIIILGLPRTGTSLLHRLLCLDQDARYLHRWETHWSVPLCQTQEEARSRAIKSRRFQTKILNRIAPRLPGILLLDMDGPAECGPLLASTFGAETFGRMARIPSFTKWCDRMPQQSKFDAYSHYRQHLQVHQWRHPYGHWVLKSPVHVTSLQTIRQVFPDAVIVQTHRDPAKSIPSFCSMVATIRSIYSESINLHSIGQELLGWVEKGINPFFETRDTLPGKKVVDINYHMLVRNPLRCVQQVYEAAEYPLPQDMEKRIGGWLKKNPRHARGAHTYITSDFGLSDDRIRRRLHPYIERFNIPREN